MTTAHLIALLGVWAAAITSPGPDTVQLTRLAATSKTAALWAAVGIMIGNTIWITLSLAGMSALLDTHPSWTHTLEIAGGSVLVWMGSQALRAGWAARGSTGTNTTTQPTPPQQPHTRASALRLGIITNLSNPKAIIFFGAIFAQFLTPGMGATGRAGLASLLILTGLAWFTGFAWAAHTIAAPLRRHAPTIDMLAGTIFTIVGLSLATSGAWALAH